MTNRANSMMGPGLFFVAGCVVGGIAGLLSAPQSGARTRRRIAHFADDVRNRAGEVADDAGAAIHRAVEKGRNLVNT